MRALGVSVVARRIPPLPRFAQGGSVLAESPAVRPVPIGIDDFRKLREQGLEYVDKSHLVREVLEQTAEVLLLPRPRRFGKTLNLSMLRYFFEKRAEDLSGLFSDLSIWQSGDVCRAHFQRYPVVVLTFKDVKAERWEIAWESMQRKIGALFDEHRDLLESGQLSDREAADFRAVIDGSAGRAVYESALLDLCRALHRRHGERVCHGAQGRRGGSGARLCRGVRREAGGGEGGAGMSPVAITPPRSPSPSDYESPRTPA